MQSKRGQIWFLRVAGFVLLGYFLMLLDLFSVIPIQIGIERIQGTIFGFIRSYRILYAVANVGIVFVLLFRTNWILQTKKQNTLSQLLWIIAIICIFLIFAISIISCLSLAKFR